MRDPRWSSRRLFHHPARSVHSIVSWKRSSHLVNCLKSIEDTGSGLAYEVIVVDNASSDGSPEAVRQGGFRNVRLVEAGANLGFAKGNNIASNWVPVATIA